MPEIIREYGEYVLEIFVLIWLVGLLTVTISDDDGNRGIFRVFGAKVPIENENYHVYTDFRGTYQEECKKSEPKISFWGSCTKIGIYKLDDCMEAVDYSGRKLQFKVESIKGTDGRERMDIYNSETTEINFAESGIYILVISATDDSNRTVRCTLQIPVNK